MVAQRVSFATELHKSKALSKLIQRELKGRRAEEIAKYLMVNEERFFNSLVIAVYGGEPSWFALDHIERHTPKFKAEDVSQDAIASIGFLSLSGGERLFALDGQHRLAGIVSAVAQDENLGDDEVSVLLVAHNNTTAGLRRTRRLFTTLNKTAKPVTKGEIIALDEADAMAITARHLVENDARFSDKRVLVAAKANLPVGDREHLTTIVNLYDTLSILFSRVMAKRDIKELQYNRPTDDDLQTLLRFATRYFVLLGEAFPELGQYFESPSPARVVRSHRHENGGSVLFRPVGMTLFANLAAALSDGRSLARIMSTLKQLPTDLGEEPYVDLLWMPGSGTIDARRQALVRRLLLHMLGESKSERSVEKLRRDVAKAKAVEVGQMVLPPVLKEKRGRRRK